MGIPRFILLIFCIFLSQTVIFAQNSGEISNIQRPPELEDLIFPEEPLNPGLGYCSKRGRPGTNETHKRWSPPVPDALYVNTDKGILPGVGGEITYDFSIGVKRSVKFRFKSQLTSYPKGSTENQFKIVGYENYYPELADFNCVSGVSYPFNGVQVLIQQGENNTGSPYINGFRVLSPATSPHLPPYVEGVSGIYGFEFEPQQNQLGKIYKIRIVAQTGVTASERDYMGIYESDQVYYDINLRVIGGTPIYESGAFGTTRDITLYARSVDLGCNNVDGWAKFPQDGRQWDNVEFYVDNELVGQGIRTAFGEGDKCVNYFTFKFNSLLVPDGLRSLLVKAKNGMGVISESRINFYVYNRELPPDGPTGQIPIYNLKYFELCYSRIGVLYHEFGDCSVEKRGGMVLRHERDVLLDVNALGSDEFKKIYIYNSRGEILGIADFERDRLPGERFSLASGSWGDKKRLIVACNKYFSVINYSPGNPSYSGRTLTFKILYSDGSISGFDCLIPE